MKKERIWEIDLLRAIAIILMVTFHIVFDLNQFVDIDINYQSGFWYWEGKISALIFIFLAGISSGFSKNNVRRGIKVFAFAMAITLVTYIVFKEQYIRFGILHFLGISMILFSALKRMNNFFLVISALAVALAAIPMQTALGGTSLLLPLGVRYSGFSTVDYYPLSPYLSVFILGILAHKLFYYKKQSLFKFSYKNKHISGISRNSLTIYLIHKPVIILMIFLLKFLAEYNL